MHAENPSYALGAVLGVTALGAAGLAVNPASKTQSLEKISGMDWGSYRNLVGSGMHLPEHRPSRDFTDLMTISHPDEKFIRISYMPTNDHYIESYARPFNFTLNYKGDGSKNMWIFFDIMAKGDRELHGSGRDMVDSAMELFRQRGVNVREHRANWIPLESQEDNHNAFTRALDKGLRPEAAAKCTFSGKCMERHGFTEVGGEPFRDSLEFEDIHTSSIRPYFRRPDFGGGPEFQHYAEAWVNSMGRPMTQLVPRVAPEPQIKPAVDVIGRLNAYLQENFTADTAAKVMDAVNDKLTKPFKGIDVAPEL